jgi:uncharacterized protein YbcC (UPF0753/DUF2309 family)
MSSESIVNNFFSISYLFNLYDKIHLLNLHYKFPTELISYLRTETESKNIRMKRPDSVSIKNKEGLPLNPEYSFNRESLVKGDENYPGIFKAEEVIHELKHYLPAQASLKDFIHHNTLHAFQNMKFQEGIFAASEIFGYKVSLSLEEYRSLYSSNRIREDILDKIISENKGSEHLKEWKGKMLYQQYDEASIPRIGQLRSYWKNIYKTDLDSLVHPLLFRIICSYLDQGISVWNFPLWENGFLASIKEMEQKSFSSFFKTKRARNLLLQGQCGIEGLLDLLVGDVSLYKQYLFDQQFGHQGWSGIVSVIESNPETLLDTRKITLKELIIFELLLEIDALDSQLGKKWEPLSKKIIRKPVELFADLSSSELNEIIFLWQQAYEWSYYDQVLAGIQTGHKDKREIKKKTFQAMFCIDDREISLRDYLEKFDSDCETFGTPGFFNVEFFFQPENGKFFTKQCPAPVTPKYLIRETESDAKEKSDLHLNRQTHSLLWGWIITHTLGLLSALKLLLNIFRPSVSPAVSFYLIHKDPFSELTIENKNLYDRQDNLQVGFTVEEMADRVEGLLRSIGLIEDFAPIVYVIGHGASSVNNPHYAAYDCGACSGRPGSVNARVFSFMANHAQVREILTQRGIDIPLETQFMGGLHDTTRDEICFYDEASLYLFNQDFHRKNEEIFKKALMYNAKERARRFESVNIKSSLNRIHEKVKRRSLSLFEPRPELNHATNALCIVGRRELTKNLFLDRRSFLNSFDYKVDPEGKYLFNILKAAAPVCGGINLEYYFSRVDNQKLGAGTKLPHNVMGLFGVANGTDGDLRPGLPSQMIEVHDPVRLMIIVEHFPEIVLKTIKKSEETYQWFINEWVHLMVIHPETGDLFHFKDGVFSDYWPLKVISGRVDDCSALIEASGSLDVIPVHIIS